MSADLTQIRKKYKQNFSFIEKNLPGYDVEWLRKKREAGMARFYEAGFPTIREEEWRHTDLGTMAEVPFEASRRNGENVKDIPLHPEDPQPWALKDANLVDTLD